MYDTYANFNCAISFSGEKCVYCPSGHYCSRITQAKEQCRPGSYSNGGSDSCEPCDAGYYCDVAGMTKEDMLQKSCPAGLTCSNQGVRRTKLFRQYFIDIVSSFWSSVGNQISFCGYAVPFPQLAVIPTVETHGCAAGYFCTGVTHMILNGGT